MRLLGSWNPHFLEKYAGVRKPRDKNLAYKNLIPKGMPSWQKENLMMGNAYSCIGTYRVKKTDIIMLKTGLMEEVVCDPHSAKLQRYDFLSWAECMGLEEARAFHYSYNTKGSKLIRTFEFDEKSLIKHYIRFYKQYYEHSELLKAHFTLKKKLHDVIKKQLNDFGNIVSINRHGEITCGYDWKQGLQKKKKAVNILSANPTNQTLLAQMKDLWK